jgi:tetratricopeptide (TPR) repeat protein
MRARLHAPLRVGVSLVAGLAWTQLALVLSSVVVPPRLALAPRIASGASYRVAEWTLLAPLSAAARLVSATGRAASVVRPSFAIALLAALLATGTCVAIALLLGVDRLRRSLGVAALLAFALSTSCSAVVAGQLHDATVAETAFFALVSRAPVPSADEATVAAAREFAKRHPLSRWRSEALRIVAMNASAEGRFGEAERVWGEFESCFDDAEAPGVAYAEYSRALCFEKLGRPSQAIACYRDALEVIRSRSDGVQAWIAPDSAKRIATLEASSGMPVTAAYWRTQSQALQDVCSIE